MFPWKFENFTLFVTCSKFLFKAKYSGFDIIRDISNFVANFIRLLTTSGNRMSFYEKQCILIIKNNFNVCENSRTRIARLYLYHWVVYQTS